jgi:hypothetical protein
MSRHQVIYVAFLVGIAAVNSMILGECHVTVTDDAEDIGCKAPPVTSTCTSFQPCVNFTCGTPRESNTVDIGIRYADPNESGLDSYTQSSDVCWQSGTCTCIQNPSQNWICSVDVGSFTDMPGSTWDDFEASGKGCKGDGG